MSTVVRAIDVGYGNTKYVTRSDGGGIHCAHFPSLAFHTPTEQVHNGLGGLRRTVAVPGGGGFYEVGPEVELAATWMKARRRNDGFTETDEYRALTAGALHYMKVDTVDLLVLGLPVAQYVIRRTQLAKAMTCAFEVGRKKTVLVKKAIVIAQPQGALLKYAAEMGAMDEILDAKCLIIDVGSRTFDWLVTRGVRVVAGQSHSVNRGVSDILRMVAESISNETKEEYTDLEAIDLGLRTGKPIQIYQKPYELKKFDKTIQNIAESAVDMMCERIENIHSFEHVVLVGGGAFLFKKAVKKRFPKLQIKELTEPMFANVRGYQLFGERYVRENAGDFVQQQQGADDATALAGQT